MNAYEREMRLMPHVIKMEERGIHIDVPLLRTDMNFYFNKMSEMDDFISMKCKRKVDVDSNDQLADGIEFAGLSKGFASTPTGRRSTSKESLMGAIADPELLGALLIRGSLATCLRTFYQPWYSAARKTGKLYVKWNQIRNYSDTGARTGRFSSSPNFQNVPTDWDKLLVQLGSIGYNLNFPLPQMRKYIIPAPGYVLIGRDYRSQEMRLLAHFTQGALMEALIADPTLDVHEIAGKMANISRKLSKTMGFAILYGAGAARVAEQLGITVYESRDLKARYLRALPEIKKFTKEVNDKAAYGEGITTLGGRYYSIQSPAIVKGVLKSFEYKLVNYKIQGSAADHTKEAMYQYATTTKTGHLLLTVHDQNVIEVPKDDIMSERKIFADAMNGSFADVLKVKMLSDECIGYDFANLRSFDEGERIDSLLGRSERNYDGYQTNTV
jgi:DNA polymerase-1